jgi:hypothetical protein
MESFTAGIRIIGINPYVSIPEDVLNAFLTAERDPALS